MRMRYPLCAMMALSFLLAISLESSAAPRAERNGCQTQALGDLERLSPRGHAVYKAMTDKRQFLTWLTCDDVQLGLATSVHESVHVLTQERDAFPLVDGGDVRRPHGVSKFFPPRDIAGNFDAKDSFVQTYLRPGGATSASDFLYLLDELNAYSHDLNSAVKLISLRRRDRQVDHRDGLTALMAFVTSYAETAQKKQPATWQGLQRPEHKQVLQILWVQAETALESSCGIAAFGRKDRDYIAFMRDPKHSAALAEIIGRAVKIPSECLSPEVTSSVPAR